MPDGLGEQELYARLFPDKASVVPRPMPDWDMVHRELSKRGVTLTLLWKEYREQHPDGYRYTQFRDHYQHWNETHINTMRIPRKAGEEMEVDYAGITLPIINPETSEIHRAAIFVYL